MGIGHEEIPFEPMVCMNQFAATLGFVAAMQGDERTERACNEAARRCKRLFEEFY